MFLILLHTIFFSTINNRISNEHLYALTRKTATTFVPTVKAIKFQYVQMLLNKRTARAGSRISNLRVDDK